MVPLRVWATLALSLGCAVVALAGCGGSKSPVDNDHAVQVKERDFHLSAPSQLPAGETTFSVRNRGPIEHELIVVRKRPGSSLPMRADGLTIDEERVESNEVGALEPGEPGVRQLDVHLAPGRYEMFCNMSGHFKAGMHHSLVVQ